MTTTRYPHPLDSQSEWNMARDEIRRSLIIHPDWTQADHLSFLEHDAFVELDATHKGRTIRALATELLFAEDVYS